MTRYLASKQFQYMGAVALVLALFCAVFAWNWPLAWIPVVLFLGAAALLLWLGLIPPIEIHETHLAIGRRRIPWEQIRRLDRTGFISPLVMHLTLADRRRILLVYPGGLEESHALLRQLRRRAREALIDGIPYRQFWGDAGAAAPEPRDSSSAKPKYRLLRPEDEADVERLYHRLKSVGRLDRGED